jgi:hypothetical protein
VSIRPLIPVTLLAAILALAPLAAKNSLPKPAQSVQALSWGGKNHCTISSINDQAVHVTEVQPVVVGLWLTAAHCVAQEQQFEIAGHPAYVVKADYPLDVAVMVTEGWTQPALQFSDHEPTYGDFVEMYGHPLGWDSVIYMKGYVSSPSMHEADMERADMVVALYNLVAAPGSSGSAVLDKHHKIIGVLQFAFHDGSFAEVSGGCTYRDLKRFLAPYLPED